MSCIRKPVSLHAHAWPPFPFVITTVLLAAVSDGLYGQQIEAPSRMKLVWTAAAQTGLTERFQLALGGLFGGGPAWQSRLETAASNVWREGDALYLYGAESMDLGSRRSDWQAGAGYRQPLLKRRRHELSASFGLQHWKFANVLRGANDWLLHENLTLRSRLRLFALTLTSDSLSLLASPLPEGTLLHTQVWMEHPVWSRDTLQLVMRHGPAHTYSWGFYGANGHRVARYQSAVVLAAAGTRFEFGYRQQIGLQPRIPDNRLWHFMVSRSIKLR